MSIFTPDHPPTPDSRGDDPLVKLISQRRSAVLMVSHMLVDHQHFDDVDVLADRLDAQILATTAADWRGHAARQSLLVDLLINEGVSDFALELAMCCRGDAETHALAEFGHIPDEDA